jgi:branched-chain amino acid transport system substrate-binding protein
MNRRDFIKTAALTAGAVLVPPIRGLAGSQVNIGVLYPQSTIDPDIGLSYLAGLSLYLELAGNQAGERSIRLLPEEYTAGLTNVCRKAAGLIKTDVDMVVGIIGSRMVSELQKMFHDSHTFLILNNIGANPIFEARTSPYIFSNSLNLWQTSWAMGNWAADNIGRHAVIATSFYDSGYAVPLAFQDGFEQAGGKIEQTYVTGAPSLPACTVDRALSEIAKVSPDVVYGSYCGPSAVRFVKSYTASALSARVPMVGHGFMVDDRNLPVLSSAALGIKSSLSWMPAVNTAENQAFTGVFRERTGKPADAFAVLGYETAQLLVRALNAASGDLTRTATISSTLETALLNSPRGKIQMQAKTHATTGPIYLSEVRQRGLRTRNEVICEFAQPNGLNLRWNGVQSGWTNPYLALC